MKIKRALISVYDKKGIEVFARELSALGIELISTDGTYRKIVEAGIPAKKIEDLTEFPEIMNGRVKTLHPKIHAGILANRKIEEHLKQAIEQGIELIDLVVVNLYPFKETISKPHSLEEAIEKIDVGGIAMLRAAAKNFESVAVVVDPKDYEKIIKELKENKKELSEETHRKLMVKVFEVTAFYDSIIANYFREKFSLKRFPERIALGFEKLQECRYGENPHQRGAIYKSFLDEAAVTQAKQLQGKEMSFNNFFDANAGVELIKEFSDSKEAVAAILKHSNPCGCAVDKSLSEAFRKAFEGDKESAFGGVIVLNKKVDLRTAKQITSFFNELVIAPGFEKSALKEFAKKPNLRLLELRDLGKKRNEKEFDAKKVVGGLLLQERDLIDWEKEKLQFVSKKQLENLLFASKIVKQVKSNAIVLVKNKQLIGVGAGQSSRIESVNIALRKAGKKAKGSVLASDGFFPFKDSVQLAAKVGVSAIVEPGGSIKDKEVIEEANKKGIPLVFTGLKHFKH